VNDAAAPARHGADVADDERMRKLDIDAAATAALLQRVFGGSPAPTFERTPDGVSTQVYRVTRGSDTFYLRIAEEADDDLGTDAELHRRLRQLGIVIPDVIHVEPFDPDIGRSVMITTEVPGRSLADISRPAEAAAIARDAGRDLALVNGVPVDGFGFIRRRGAGWPLRGEYDHYDAFVTSHLPRVWPGALASLFTHAELDVIDSLLDQQRGLPPAQAALAHGDFDVTPIFCAGSRYTGLIDFGEIRGAEPFYDLGHFLLHDRETLPAALLPAVLHGYQHIRPLPADHAVLIRRSGVLLGMRQLCRWLGPPRGYALDHPAIAQRTRRIKELIAQP
jgi:aminoglycoside phosphotransferase (APT) family kinase protein